MKLKLLTICSIIALNAQVYAQKFTTAEEVINKYLELTKIKDGAAAITDMSMSMTTETSRGVSESDLKMAFPLKYSMTIYANGMTIMSTTYDGEKLQTKSNWGGGNQEPKTGKVAKIEANKMNPFAELEYAALGLSTSFLGEEGEHYVIEVKDETGKSWKNYYNIKTGFKDKVWVKTETPRGVVESTSMAEAYKAYKGSEVLFPSIRKQSNAMMGEMTTEVQSIKFNKGTKAKDFIIE